MTRSIASPLLLLLAASCAATPRHASIAPASLPPLPVALPEAAPPAAVAVGPTATALDPFPELSLYAFAPAPGEGGEEGEKKNGIGLFLGGTEKDGVTQGSVGAKYERHMSELTGIGLIAEYTPALGERLVTFPALFVHPWRELSLAFAPGIEVEDSETNFVFRIGVGWDFELGGGFSLAPELNYDLVDDGENAVVLGLTTGYAF